jgi:anti-anti-sigma factor
MSSLLIEGHRHQTHHQIQLAGHFADVCYDQFRESVYMVVESDPANVLLELADLKSIVSSGLGLMAALSKSLSEQGFHLLLVAPQPQIAALIRTIQLDRVMPIHQDPESALAAL